MWKLLTWALMACLVGGGLSPAYGGSDQPAASRRRTLHQFVEKDGGVIFTNRPEKYRASKDFVEVKVRYERIKVPEKYQRFSSAADYASGTIQELVSRYCTQYGVEEGLVYAVIQAESGFNPNAVSSKGARGLMQLMPGTAAEMGVTDIFDPAQNIAGGTQYLARMLELFNNDNRLALAAYNAGPERVKAYNGVPPYKETQNYVKLVLGHARRFKLGGATVKSQAVNRQYKSRSTAVAALDKKRYMVHFHSGLTQPADEVVDKDPYYYIVYGKRTYPVRKELVKEIEEPV